MKVCMDHRLEQHCFLVWGSAVGEITIPFEPGVDIVARLSPPTCFTDTDL